MVYIKQHYCQFYYIIKHYKIVVSETQRKKKDGKPIERAWIHKHMIKLEKGIYQCKVCRAKLRMPHGLYGNMKRHYKAKHPEIYAKECIIFVKSKGIYDNKGSSRNIVSIKNYPDSFSGAWIKQYMILLREGLYQCNICCEKLRMRYGKYGNMKRHFQSKHPYVYAKETNVLEDEKESEIQIFDKRLSQNTTCINKKLEPPLIRSWVSKYMSKIKEGFYQCNVCSIRLKINHNTYANLKRHIIRKHPIIHATETNTLNINYKEKHSSLPCEKVSKINEIAEAGAYDEIHAEQTIESKNDNHSEYVEEVMLEECIVEAEGSFDLSNVAYVIENCEAASDTTNVESDTENDLLESVGPLSACDTDIETKKSE